MCVLQIATQNFFYQFNFDNDDKKAENTYVSVINSIRVLTFFFTNSKSKSGTTHLTTTPNDPWPSFVDWIMSGFRVSDLRASKLCMKKNPHNMLSEAGI